ncbi:unnamed protein product, partial [Iphiclides podalirius]
MSFRSHSVSHWARSETRTFTDWKVNGKIRVKLIAGGGDEENPQIRPEDSNTLIATPQRACKLLQWHIYRGRHQWTTCCSELLASATTNSAYSGAR